jgi:hypothetical protein
MYGLGTTGDGCPPTGFLGIVDSRRRLNSGCELNLSSIIKSNHGTALSTEVERMMLKRPI